MSELKKCYESKALSPEWAYMPKEEWEERIKKARVLMDKSGIDALMLLNDWDWTYYFGFVIRGIMVFPLFGIVPKEGPTTFMSESLYANIIEVEGYAERVVGYRGDTAAPTAIAPDPIVAQAELIKDMGLDQATIGIEMGPFSWFSRLTITEWERLKKLLPKVKWVDASNSVIWPQRKIKTPWEHNVIRKLYNACCKGYLKGIEVARSGINEKDVYKAILQVWSNEGILDGLSEVAGVNTGRRVAPGPFRDHILINGDSIFLDGGPRYKYYAADCQRVIWIGNPGTKIREWAQAAEIAAIEVESILKPGTSLGAIWQKGHEVLARYIGKELWDSIRSPDWIGWVGHSTGFGLHEPPYMNEHSPEVLEPGMVICIELPAFDVKKRIVYNWPEDAYIITETGFECLTDGLGSKGIYIKD
jgi:Xaa-Pro aminopeptidase